MMTRWINSYNEFKKSEEWQLIINFDYKFDINSLNSGNIRQEAIRLKKMVVFIYNIMESIDPEIVAIEYWKEIQLQLNNFPNFNYDALNYDSGELFFDLMQANTCVDNVFISLRPYITSDKATARAEMKAIRSYEKNVTEAFKNIDKESLEAFSRITELKIKVDDINTEFQNYSITLFGNGEENENEITQKGLKVNIEGLFDEIKKINTKINDYYLDIFEDSNKTGIKTQIIQAKTVIEENKKSIEKELRFIEEKIKNFNEFYDQIYGPIKELSESEKQDAYEDNNEREIRVGGLKEEIDKRLKNLAELKTEHKDTYEALKIQIETLLPDATNAGLASAYAKRKKVAEKRSIINTIFLTICILILIFIPIISMYYHPWIKDADSITSIYDAQYLILRLLWIAPFSGPILWLAIVNSKRRSENNRLAEEYAHKEATAMSYDSYKYQIDALMKNKEALQEKLLEATIDTVAYNPSVTLDKKHSEKMLIHKIIEPILKALK